MTKENYVIYGSEAEVKSFQRVLDFGKDKKIEKAYNSLIPAYKKIVNEVLAKLVGMNDYLGYNVEQLLLDYKNATPSIAHRCVGGAISYILYGGNYDDKKAIDNSNLRIYDLEKSLQMPKVTDAKGYLMDLTFELICENFLVSQELLQTGIGKVKFIKEEWLYEFQNENVFMLDDFRKYAFTIDWTTQKYIERYENYLRKNGKISTDDSILEERWAVIKGLGWYRSLVDNATFKSETKNRKREYDAIKCLIYQLYAEQLVSGRMPNIPFE